MALVKTWYETEDAAAKFGVPVEKVMQWVEEGLVRSERDGDQVVRVNIDDVRLEVDNFIRGGETG